MSDKDKIAKILDRSKDIEKVLQVLIIELQLIQKIPETNLSEKLTLTEVCNQYGYTIEEVEEMIDNLTLIPYNCGASVFVTREGIERIKIKKEG